MKRWVLIAEVDAVDEADAISEFLDKMNYMLVNDDRELEGMTIEIKPKEEQNTGTKP